MERLKPVDVRNVAFSKPRPGRRGYDETEVDTFLDLVERTLSQLYHEIALLRGEPTTPGGVGVMQLALPSGPSGGRRRPAARPATIRRSGWRSSPSWTRSSCGWPASSRKWPRPRPAERF